MELNSAGLDPAIANVLVGIAAANVGLIFTGIFMAVWKLSRLETQGEAARRDINNLGGAYKRLSAKAQANEERKAG